MARWQLRTPHYLKVPGIEWEYKETDPRTGRAARKVFEVPLYLNPEWTTDHNYPGRIVVCWAGKGNEDDIPFEGDPTPEMIPLDEEAKEVSKQFEWKNPIEGFNVDVMGGEAFTQSLLASLQRQIMQMPQERVPMPKNSQVISPDEFKALQTQVKELMEANAVLQAKIGVPLKEGQRRF